MALAANLRLFDAGGRELSLITGRKGPGEYTLGNQITGRTDVFSLLTIPSAPHLVLGCRHVHERMPVLLDVRDIKESPWLPVPLPLPLSPSAPCRDHSLGPRVGLVCWPGRYARGGSF